MPSDIRSFFGGNSSSQTSTPGKTTKPKETPAKSKGKSSKRRVVDDSDEDEEIVLPTRTTPKKPTQMKPESTPKYTATSATAYFGNKKPKRSAAAKADAKISASADVETLPRANGSSKRTPNPKSKSKKKRDDEFEDLDNDDDIFTADYKNVKNDYYDEGSELEEEDVKPKPTTKSANKNKKTKEEEEDFMEVEEKVDTKPSKAANGRKRKSDELDEPKPTPKKTTPAKKAKKVAYEDSEDVKQILNSIQTVRAPTPPEKDAEGKFKPNWKARDGPVAAGTSEIPSGAENCLAGLTFVFTGVLTSLDRDTGIALVKQHGGKVVTAPSKRTSFVVLGVDAGPKKLSTIRENNLKTIDENGLFQLIRTLPANGGSGAAAQSAKDKEAQEQSNALKIAMEMEAAEKAEQEALESQAKKAAKVGQPVRPAPKTTSSDNKLWTVKHAPQTMEQIVGNKAQVTRLCEWLRNFRKNARLKFKLAGKDGTGAYRAVIISGPPGIGKTTAAHLAAKLEGYDIVESNASDSRSKKLIEDGLKGVLGTTSLLGYFAGDGKAVDESKRKLVLIMDEVDGMSAGDRGGVGAMAAICKKSTIPIIMICNERKLPKMKPFDHVAYDMPFRRPTTDQIRSRIMTIAYREKLQLPPTVLNALIEGTGADIRQVINMISTVKIDEGTIDYSKGKEMSKAWEKHVILKPWDITSKILGPAMHDKNSKSTLNDKIELYFNDHEFSYLMLQENYLNTQPVRAGAFTGPERKLKLLELVEHASESISDGDLVDRLIHGTQQQWSLMPTHAIFSFVRPSSFINGSLGYGGTSFTSWLGNNSKYGKLSRMVKEIQGHMRLRCSADRHEVRQQYVPMFWNQLHKKLEKDGKDSIPEIIDLMDSYFLTKDDFDAVGELGIGEMDEKNIKIPSLDKSAFTRIYNQQSHPLPFMKASHVFQPKKAAKERPDLEEALEDSDHEQEGVEAAAAKEELEENDLAKDKYIKAPKKKAAPKASGAGKGKKRAVESDAEDSEPKKAKNTKGKGRAKK